MLPAERLASNLIAAVVWGADIWLFLRYLGRDVSPLIGITAGAIVLVVLALVDDMEYWGDLDRELMAKFIIGGLGAIALINLICVNLFP